MRGLFDKSQADPNQACATSKIVINSVVCTVAIVNVYSPFAESETEYFSKAIRQTERISYSFVIL